MKSVLDTRGVPEPSLALSITLSGPNYRKRVLTGLVEVRLKKLLTKIAESRDWTLQAVKVMPDHVHTDFQGDPRWAPAEITFRFKAVTSRVLRQEVPSLRSELSISVE
jgi:putative transposase